MNKFTDSIQQLHHLYLLLFRFVSLLLFSFSNILCPLSQFSNVYRCKLVQSWKKRASIAGHSHSLNGGIKWTGQWSLFREENEMHQRSNSTKVGSLINLFTKLTCSIWGNKNNCKDVLRSNFSNLGTVWYLTSFCFYLLGEKNPKYPKFAFGMLIFTNYFQKQ